jgi:hypothetical protein
MAAASAGNSGIEVVERVEIPDLTGRTRAFELAIGDVTAASSDEPIDLLVVSAFPGDHTPVRGTVIGRLADLGIHVDGLFREREEDWVGTWQCWISGEITGTTAAIARLLCFEHGASGVPEDLVGNVFRSIREWVLTAQQGDSDRQTRGHDRSLGTVRMPILSSGNQRHSPASMLVAIVEQAIVHLRAGLPVERIQLVIRPSHPELSRLLVAFGKCVAPERLPVLMGYATPGSITYDYDLFLSYRRTDTSIARAIQDAVQSRRRDVRMFVDQHDLQPGCHWKPALLEALAASRHALCVVTDTYDASAECIDEFHGAVCIARSRPGYLVPLLCLRDRTVAQLPLSLRGVNFIPAACPPTSLAAVGESILLHMDRYGRQAVDKQPAARHA